MNWFKKRKAQKQEKELKEAELLMAKMKREEEERINKMKSIRNELIGVGVKTLCSTELLNDEKIKLINQIIDTLEESGSVHEDLFQIAKQSFEYQIENFTNNQDLNKKIKERYNKFNQQESFQKTDDYAIAELILYSNTERESSNNVKIKTTTYSTNEDGMFDYQITGTKYVEPEAWEIIKTLERGDELTLIAEPENEYDENAIAIYYEDVKLGYVPKAVNAEMRLYSDDPELDYNCMFKKASEHEIPFVWVNSTLENPQA